MVYVQRRTPISIIKLIKHLSVNGIDHNILIWISIVKILWSTKYIMNVQIQLIYSNTKCILKAGQHCVSNVTLHETNFQHIPRDQFSLKPKVIWFRARERKNSVDWMCDIILPGHYIFTSHAEQNIFATMKIPSRGTSRTQNFFNIWLKMIFGEK